MFVSRHLTMLHPPLAFIICAFLAVACVSPGSNARSASTDRNPTKEAVTIRALGLKVKEIPIEQVSTTERNRTVIQVIAVQENTTAWLAGIQPSDILLTVGSARNIASTKVIERFIATTSYPNRQHEIEVYGDMHDGTQRRISLLARFADIPGGKWITKESAVLERSLIPIDGRKPERLQLVGVSTHGTGENSYDSVVLAAIQEVGRAGCNATPTLISSLSKRVEVAGIQADRSWIGIDKELASVANTSCQLGRLPKYWQDIMSN